MTGSTRATVYLVGAGPGDPELLTVKAYRLLERADVVVYDRLVSETIMDLVPAGATRIFAGKARGQHHMRQEDINALLARLAESGRVVVRLKGGDPFVFGRGSEEAEYLIGRGIDVEIVPGITAAAGCSAYAGIPLTHRGFATGVRFVTGHCREGHPLDLNWASLADTETTLVVYMGLANVEEISSQLIGAGMPADLPSAVVANGTTAIQQVVVTTLGELPAAVRREAIQAPALFVIGRVAALAEVLQPATRSWTLAAERAAARAGHA